MPASTSCTCSDSAAGAIALRRLWRSAWLRRALLATDQSTSQLRVRRALFASASSLALMPALVAGILVARAGPAVLYRRRLGGGRQAAAAGLLQATMLTFPVVVAEVGRSLGLLTSATAAALVGAALLSVLLFPAAALALRPWTEQSGPRPGQPSLVAQDPAG